MKNNKSSRDEVNVASAVPDWALLKWYSDDVKHTEHAGLLHSITSECVAEQFVARSQTNVLLPKYDSMLFRIQLVGKQGYHAPSILTPHHGT